MLANDSAGLQGARLHIVADPQNPQVRRQISGEAGYWSRLDALANAKYHSLAADGNHYSLNTMVPLHTWMDLSIISRGNNRTFASIQTDSDEKPQEHEFIARLGINGDYFVWAPIAIEAPLHKVGDAGRGWNGNFDGSS